MKNAWAVETITDEFLTTSKQLGVRILSPWRTWPN